MFILNRVKNIDTLSIFLIMYICDQFAIIIINL